MAQKTNLNISPYYDDFDSEKNFYKVLFRPGYPVQARELTTLQSILQDQVESFGSHIFKEGSVVIPGNIAFDGQFYSVKLNSTNSGVDVALYIDNFIGKTITGQTSNTTARIQHVEVVDGVNVDELTIYVKYLDSNSDFTFTQFEDGEQLTCDENVVYGNTTISAGTPFASLVASNATSIGSAASIGKGVYFIRGSFVNVSQQTIILDYYTSTPSYRVGLKIDELIINAKDDDSLYDNAKGFSNYAAPGADRFKINLTLTKKLLTDTNDTDFVELLRLKEGKIQKLNTKTQYNKIRDYLAERTYDESGDYAVEPFDPTVHNSLNNRLGNNGIFFDTEKTEEGNIPTDDLMCLKISPGKAYVRGYDVEKVGTTIIDVDKPRDTEEVTNVSVPFEMGHLVRINNVTGIAKHKAQCSLWARKLGDSPHKIGDARVYTCNVSDAAYKDATTQFDLRLYDLQTYTILTLNQSVDATDLPSTAYVKGKSSGASGYAALAGANNTVVTLRQTSGKFAKGEQITINGIDASRTIASFIEYGTQNIKAITQGASTGFEVGFAADTVCTKFPMPGGINRINFPPIGNTGASGVATVTASGQLFTGIRTDTIISYHRAGFSADTYNRVTNVASDGLSIELSPIGSGIAVTSVYDGKLLNRFNTSSSRPQGDQTWVQPFAMGPVISDTGGLYAELPDLNISSVNLLNSNLTVSEQLTGRSTNSSGVLTFDLSASGISSAVYATFDQERYSLSYATGGIGTITSDTFDLSNNTVTLRGLRPSQSGSVVVNTTLQKYGVQSKVKQYNRSQQVSITRSKYEKSGVGVNTSVVDGLTHNVQYGLRVQDEEICLNYPDVAKVLTIYESLDTGAPTLDKILFTSTASVHTNAVIGENVEGNTSNAVARVVSTPTANTLEIVYLTSDTFEVGETVTFEESNIITEVETITLGSYKNITESYDLDKGQKEQYYDYSRLIRRKDSPVPTRKLLVVFDYYSVPENDNGDVFTVLSYDKERFAQDIPFIGPFNIRASDTLDFRPRVSVFDPSTSFDSPFDFNSRDIDGTNGPKLLLSPDEASIIGYDYYLARIDKLYLNKYGQFIVEKGISSRFPKAPIKNDALLEIATINLPPYLYNPQDASLSLVDNRRYTMRDIGDIEDRVENLEEVTTLSLLELNTQSLQIQDADGRDRFKSGFFVDPFKDTSLIDGQLSSVEINPVANELTPIIARNSLKSQIAPSASITDQNLDLTDNFELLDPNVQKTGQSVTLKYDEIDWIEQPFATTVENVNPFNVVSYTGTVQLNPEVDTWVRTIQLPDRNIRVTTNRSRSITQNLTSRIRLNLGEARFTNTRRETRGWGNNSRTRTIWTNREVERLRARSRSVSTATNVDTISFDDVNTRNELRSTTDETFMRSRNTEFRVSNLKPFTRFYQFLDGNSGVDFTPKLIEIANSSSLANSGTQGGTFEVGETVIGSIQTNFSGAFGPTNFISFRVATSNHKSGSFNNPDSVYNVNPYIRGESIPASYSQSSKTLNIDTASLSQEAQGLYSGYLVKGMKLVGQTSGAIAYVKDLRLVSDNYGDLNGTFFIRDPHTALIPSVRIQTGTKTFKITSSSTNDPGLPGSNSVSFGETNYTADGTLNQWQNEVTTTTRNLTTTTTTNLTTDASARLAIRMRDRVIVTERYSDPLAQTFIVGGNVEAPSDLDTSDDINGAYLTAVDLYFAKVDPGNAPCVVQIRTTLLGTPTRTVLGNSVTLRPTTTDADGNTVAAIQTSDTGEVATKVTFPEPIYLAPNAEYAVVIISANSDEYELWTATMGEKTVGTQSLPDVESVRYTQQFALGSLFKSQNGSIWSANQYQDLKFKLYKASFTSESGTAFFYNPTLDNSNGYVPNLGTNAIRTLPKSGSIGITTIAGGHPTLVGILTEGRKLAGQGGKGGSAVVVGRGSSVNANAGAGNSLGITEGGTNYKIDTSVDTFNITGSGTGLKLEINSINADTGAITGIAIASPGSTDPTTDTHGNGYNIGDVVGIVTSSVVSQTGDSARITITGISTDIDTLYLSNIQGEFGSTGSNKSFAVGAAVSYYNDSGTVVSAASTTIRSTSATGGVESGNLMRVEHFNHGMYSTTNKVTLSDIETTIAPTTLSAKLSLDEATSVSVASTANFTTFEGVTVDSNNPGYIKVGNEIIKYDSVGSGILSIASNGRAIDSTIVSAHDVDILVHKYELNGVSLRRINKTHTISEPIGIDDYYITIDRSSDGPGIDRDTDLDTGTGMPELSFNNEESTGGSNIKATENILYNSVIPTYSILTPGSSTSINATIRTISGTSIDGTENSFNDEGFEPLGINVLNTFNTARIVCSQINENTYLTNLPRNKSFTTGITLNSSDSNLSPIIFLDEALTEFRISRLDKPILNYPTNSSVNSIFDDPHAAVYVSNTIQLANPATSLKVLLSAYRDSSADFRVLYNLIKADSSEVDQTFQLFPGYDNLKNTEQSGIAVVDESKNSGLPDSFVPDSLSNEFLEYEFTADNLELFTGYTIKIVMSGTNQATPPRIKELRTLAVR